jgi:hypothetical protein
MRTFSTRFHHATLKGEAPACSHRVLTPQWVRNETHGQQDRALAFRCEACRAIFSGEAGKHLLVEPRAAGGPPRQ